MGGELVEDDDQRRLETETLTRRCGLASQLSMFIGWSGARSGTWSARSFSHAAAAPTRSPTLSAT